jgi:hypothetical protein
VSRRRALGLGLALAAGLAACTSPEATRMRAGGPGADVGNRRGTVEMHEGARPYWRTPSVLAERVPASNAERTRRTEAPAASPR